MRSLLLTPPLARQLAEFVLSTRGGDLPALALEHAKMSLASTLASVSALVVIRRLFQSVALRMR